MARAIFAVAAVLAISAVGAAARTTRWHELEAKAYDHAQYVAEFGKAYASAEEHAMRKEVFEGRLARIMAHNRDTTKTWKEGVNHLTDRTDGELKAMMGYKKAVGYTARGNGTFCPHMEAKRHEAFLASGAPTSLDWRMKENVISPVKDQGQCGSCWTFATAATVESWSAIKTGQLQELSEQQIASCSPNPKDCGGTGGCEGGTAQVGFAGIQTAGGVASEWTYPYTSYMGTDSKCAATGIKKVVQLSGFKNVATNSYADLMSTLQDGPVAISVAAMSWSSYESGVYNGCNATSPDIDHAVQVVGYGTDATTGQDYWIVRNSWSPSWGEDGYIRLLRQGANAKCGMDTRPMDGDGCKGGPTQVKVCGTCGILYDNAVPTIA